VLNALPSAQQDDTFVQKMVDDAQYLHVFGDVDLGNVRELEAALAIPMEAGRRLVIDLTQCAYIDCSVLTVLVRTYAKMGRRLCIVTGGAGVVTLLLEVTGLGRSLPIVPSLSQAFAKA
jgi:anti-anti-sigma factor